MILETLRHNRELLFRGHLICAPRIFVIGEYSYYVHILDWNCTKVLVYCGYRDSKQVYFHSSYKTYINSKGLYFNFSSWIDNDTKIKFRIYLGE